jgi:subtilase family serine protease
VSGRSPDTTSNVTRTVSTRKLAAIVTAGFVSLGVAQLAAPAQATSHTTQSAGSAGDGPAWVSRATRTGSPSPSTKLHLAVWLKQRDPSGLAHRTRAIYTRGSGYYHHYLTAAQVTARYAPTTHQVGVVRRYLSGHGFHVDSVAGNRAYVNVTGTVKQAEGAFGVTLNTYRYQGKTYRANASAPRLAGIAGGHIHSVSGLDSAAAYRPTIRRTTPAASTTPWDGVCGGFSTTKTVDLIHPTATRTLHGFIPCDGYTGAQLQKAYGVDQLPDNAGAGQTVAIVDAYGSPTILQDANKFSEVAGLPKLDSSNFQLVQPKGIGNKKESKAQDPLGWQAEVTLDVEAVHAMAPGAKIVLVVAPNNYASLDEAVNWVTVRHLANIVTNSWGLPFDLASPGQGSRDERMFMTAAAQGIGLNFSSGDNGDEEARVGYRTVDFPASSPWVNAVGGTSLFLGSDDAYDTETGWGTTLLRLGTCAASSTTVDGQKHCDGPYDQANRLDEGFQGGAGGGLSYFYNAQPWQSAAIGSDTAAGFGTVGTHRAVPDISMLADPYTGMGVWITDLSLGDTAPEVETYGGTSLASPLFAGIMADVDQARAAAGHGPAGLASQYLYDLPSGAVRDVLPPTFGNPNESAAGRADSRSLFYGSFYSGSLFNVGFNSDTSLDTATGWDDVTGVGSPIAPAFVDALK